MVRLECTTPDHVALNRLAIAERAQGCRARVPIKEDAGNTGHAPLVHYPLLPS